MFPEGRYSLNESAFVSGVFPSQLGMANSMVSQSLFSAFSSDTPYNQVKFLHHEFEWVNNYKL